MQTGRDTLFIASAASFAPPARWHMSFHVCTCNESYVHGPSSYHYPSPVYSSDLRCTPQNPISSSTVSSPACRTFDRTFLPLCRARALYSYPVCSLHDILMTLLLGTARLPSQHSSRVHARHVQFHCLQNRWAPQVYCASSHMSTSIACHDHDVNALWQQGVLADVTGASYRRDNP